MNKCLLLTAALTVSAAAMAQVPLKVADSFATRQVSGQKAEVSRLNGNSKVLVYTARDGKSIKKLATPDFNQVIRPMMSRAAGAAETADAADVLRESFEGWDGTTTTWVPEGWTVESKGDAAPQYYNKWYASARPAYGPAPTDGNYMYGVIYASVNQDEWLISPSFTVGQNMNLYFDLLLQPFWFYDSYSEGAYDWDENDFVGERKIVYDIKINVREDGGEWVTVKDYAEEFKTMSGADLQRYNLNEVLMPQSVNLRSYVGKNIQVAFQYVGNDGNSTYLDDVRVGFPQLDAPVYMMPFTTQYWGFDRDMQSVTSTGAIFPVSDELTFSSYEYVPDATYEWSYADPADADNTLTEEGDMLTVSYGIRHANEFNTADNLLSLPFLTVSAPDAISASYKSRANYMQIGGKPNFKFSDGTYVEMGMLPFQFRNDQLGTYTYSPDFGVTLPVFGYSDKVDAYWTSYTFPNEEDANAPGNGVKVTKILNMIYPSATSPMVVTGVHLPAYIRNIGENVEFAATIYPMLLDEEAGGYVPDFDVVIAEAKLLGKDIKVLSEGDQRPDLANLGFTFDKPVILQAGDDVQAYVVAISGFNNPEVGYFCPFQQLQAAEVPMAFGWLYKEITYQGETRTSLAYMIDLDTMEPMMCAFAINLEGYYPWLHSEAELLEIGNDATTIGLHSYYAAEDIEVTAPEWADVKLTGRYGETVLTVNAPLTDTAREGEITLTAPGVTKTFKLTQAAGVGSGIDDVVSAADDIITAVFDLAGKQVNAAKLTTGVYLVHYASGAVKKVVVK